MAKIEPKKYTIENKTLIIRNSIVEDAEAIIELMKKMDLETRFLMREPDEFTMTVEQERAFIESKLEEERGVLILAEVDGKIVGSCGMAGSLRKRVKHSVNLGISIEKEYWGMGIGKKLMETAIQWARETGLTRITLQVDSDNYKAIGMYLKMGFEIEGTLRKDKLLTNGQYINSYTMGLLL